MNDTIFMRIVRKEIPAEIVYEDEHALAFLDIAPSTEGHTLVIPKKPFRNIFDIDDETLSHLIHAVRVVAPAVRDAVGAKGVHINSNHEHEGGQEVFHFHFHIIPRTSRDSYEFCWPKIAYDQAHGAMLAARIRNQLS